MHLEQEVYACLTPDNRVHLASLQQQPNSEVRTRVHTKTGVKLLYASNASGSSLYCSAMAPKANAGSVFIFRKNSVRVAEMSLSVEHSRR
jgi:hypothetical protein